MNRRIFLKFNYWSSSKSPLLATDYSTLEMEENDCYASISSPDLDDRNGSFWQMQTGPTILDGGSQSRKLFFVQEMYSSPYVLQCQDLTSHVCGAPNQSETQIEICAQYSIRQPSLGHELAYFLSACPFKMDFASEKGLSLLGCCILLCWPYRSHRHSRSWISFSS